MHRRTPSVTITLTTPNIVPVPILPNSTRITSLCDTLGNGSLKNSQTIGTIETEHTWYEVHMPNDETSQRRDLNKPPVTLAQILSGEKQRRLSRRQRYSLCLTLASSYVQLKDTPWLYSSWS